MNYEFQLAQKSNFSFQSREGETRLWEKLVFGSPQAETKYLILGISEDHGPQWNKGLPGANYGFRACIEKFGHMQSNLFLDGSEIGILGEIQQKEGFSQTHNHIEELDKLVEDTINNHLQDHQQLIVIGGGHNNALPLLRVANKRFGLNSCINIDPHADLRSMEERHSGNPFSFAWQEGVLQQYHVLGLHEAYNNTYILNQFEQENMSYQSFESFLDSPADFLLKLDSILNTFPDRVQLDIDLDSIPFMPSSAWTPSGFSLDQVRSFLRLLARTKSIPILHLPEGAPKTEEELRFYSKSLAYLMSDFIKVQNNNFPL